jgi:hypothetical protein
MTVSSDIAMILDSHGRFIAVFPEKEDSAVSAEPHPDKLGPAATGPDSQS